MARGGSEQGGAVTQVAHHLDQVLPSKPIPGRSGMTRRSRPARYRESRHRAGTGRFSLPPRPAVMLRDI
jgi:hypothetical protein